MTDMERNEAINYLKDLLRNTNNMSPESVSFEQLAEWQGYTVRIKGAIHEFDKEVVRNTAKRHNLNVREEKNQILIYKPK